MIFKETNRWGAAVIKDMLNDCGKLFFSYLFYEKYKNKIKYN